VTGRQPPGVAVGVTMNSSRTVASHGEIHLVAPSGAARIVLVKDDLAALAERTTSPTPSRLLLHVSQVAAPARVLAASTSVADLEGVFWDDNLTSVVVTDPEADRAGLISSRQFHAAMSGRLGYGRAVLLRRTAGDLTDWRPLVVPHDAAISDVATSAMNRKREHRYDDVLVLGDTWSLASAADVTLALVSRLAQTSTHDPLTGLPTRGSTLHDLARRCEMAKGGRARVVLMLIDVRGIKHVNKVHGLAVGDAILRQIGRGLDDARPRGCTVGRIDGHVFAVMATLPPSDDARAIMDASAITRQMLASVRTSHPDVPPDQSARVFTGEALSTATSAVAHDLLHAAEQRAREARRRAKAERG